MGDFKEQSIVHLKDRSGKYVIDEVPTDKDGLYVIYEYNNSYNRFSCKEDNILPLTPSYCWHQFRTIDIGLCAKKEIRYCEVCGIKFDDLERTKSKKE